MPPLSLKPVPTALAASRRAFLSHPTRSLSTLPVAISAAPQTRCLASLPDRYRPCKPPSAVQPRRTLTSRRRYHSYDHPAPAGPFSETERTILAAAYKHVPEVGFSQDALALGARDSGYLDISTNLLPDGIFSLIQWHLVTQREALSARRQALFGIGDETDLMPVSERAEVLTWERLVGNAPTIHRWQEVRAPPSVKALLYSCYPLPPTRSAWSLNLFTHCLGSRGNGTAKLHPGLFERASQARGRDLVLSWRQGS